MKIFKFLFVSILFITVTACGDDDDAVPEDTSGDLIGTWQMTDLDYSGTSSSEFMGIPLNQTFTGFAKDIDYSITFTENPNEFEGNGGYTIELTTTTGGQSATIDETVSGEANGTWELNGMNLTITANGQTEDLDISVLNENTLTFTSEVTETIDVNGITSTTNVTVTSSFTR